MSEEYGNYTKRFRDNRLVLSMVENILKVLLISNILKSDVDTLK